MFGDKSKMKYSYYIIALIKNIKSSYKKIILRERKCSWGKENPDKVFYLIRHASNKVGLFAYVMCNAPKIKYAIENGYIPIVDMQNYKNPYLEKSQVGKINAWEFFYEQPTKYTLKDIKKSKNIIISDAMLSADRPTDSMDFLNNAKVITDWRGFFEEYIRIQPELLKAMNKERDKLFYNHKRILGISLRGTDYTSLKPYQHPIQPTIEQALTKTKEILNNYEFDAIYLATEDDKIFKMFQQEFGTMLLSSERKRYSNTGKKYVTKIAFNRKNDNYLKGIEYFTNIYILSQCNALVAGRAGGSVAALIMGKQYDFTYFFDYGYYGIDDIN